MEDPEEVVYEYNGGRGSPWGKEHSVPNDARHVRVNSSVKKIGDYAFYVFTSLESITIPEGVEVIGEEAFRYCIKLQSIEFPSTLKTIEERAFWECKSLEFVKFNEGLEIIGEEAFTKCEKLQFIEFPSTLKEIQGFTGCHSLEFVTFNEGPEIIGIGAFEGCIKLQSIEFPSTLKTIEKRAFWYCELLEFVKFNEGLETIGGEAFQNCQGLQSIEFPSTLKKIRWCAFATSGLKSVELNEGLESIDRNAFKDSSDLQSIDFPSTLKEIRGFAGCHSLKSVKFNEGPETIGVEAFENCQGLQSIYLPSTLKAIGKGAFSSCPSLRSVKLNEGLETIGEDAFRFGGLKSVELNEGLEIIGNGAFAHLDLQSIDVPSTLKIWDYAFARCLSLESVKFKEGLEIIGEGAFFGCDMLKSIDLPPTLKRVSSKAFQKCISLKSVKFNEGLETLADFAFSHCTKLPSIDFPTTLTTMQTGIFEKCPNLSNFRFTPLSKAKKEPAQGNTLLHQMLETKCSYFCIESFLQSCPSAIRDTNIFGQTPLHLCITNRHSKKTTKMVYTRWPEALSSRNEIGKTPLDYYEEDFSYDLGNLFSAGGFVKKMPPDSAYYLKDNEWTPLEIPELLRYKRLIFEIPKSMDEKLLLRDDSPKIESDEYLRHYFYRELSTRNLLFGKLLKEFANLIKFDDKLVIQRAAALEALCGDGFMSKYNTGYVDFKAFSSSALWYQQEILKLVLRVYHEDQASTKSFHPSIIDDAEYARDAMENGAKSVSENRTKSFTTLVDWIVDKLEADKYELKGPVLKPLQSLFNKMYIRRGQTKVSIVGDMTRATLIIKDESDFVNVVENIENEFPDILQFASPDNIGIVEFMNRVHKMKKVPKSQIIPYRFKPNGSQKKKETKRYYNLNFFDTVPEYHKVGNTEIFVAFELQIGLEAELNSLRDHKAYEKDRILKGQKLLDNYIKCIGDKNDSNREISTPSSPHFVDKKETETDFKIMENILKGNFSYHRWRVSEKFQCYGESRLLSRSSTPFINIRNREVNELFNMAKVGAFRVLRCCSKSSFMDCWNPNLTTARLCLNNKRLNGWIQKDFAVVFDKITSLDASFQYNVTQLFIRWDPPPNPSFTYCKSVHVGLFAHVGPYMVNVASRRIFDVRDNQHVVLVSSVNLQTLEPVTPLPVGCDTVLLICWGSDDVRKYRETCYDGMKLTLQKYEKLE